MKTTTRIIAAIVCLGCLCLCLCGAQAEEPIILGRVEPEAELKAVRSMKVVDDDNRIAIITWFPSEIFKSCLSIHKDGSTHYSYSNPFRRGPRRSLPDAAPSAIPKPGLNTAILIMQELPPSSEPDNKGNLLILSVRTEGQWLHYLYDRTRPPKEVQKLCAALGVGEIVKMDPEQTPEGDVLKAAPEECRSQQKGNDS